MEWNINARGGNDYIIPKLVPDEISKKNPDVVILVEFSIGFNFDYFKGALESTYDLLISPCVLNKTGRNQIAILVKKKTLDIYNIITVNPLDNQIPELMEIKAKYKNKYISIIGVRIKSQDYKIKEQIKYLNNYLQSISTDTDFICLGDFNSRDKYLKAYLNDITTVNPVHDKRKYNSDQWIDNYSFLFVDENIITGAAELDHAIIRKGTVNKVKYSWDFINESKEYPNVKEIIKGNKWNIAKGMPDHSIFTFEYNLDNK